MAVVHVLCGKWFVRVVGEGRVRPRRNALVHLTKSTKVSTFLAQARVPGEDRGATSIISLTMKLIVPHTRQLSFLSQLSVGCGSGRWKTQVTRPSFLFPIFF